MTYVFTNIIGTFVLDDNLKIIDSIEFKKIDEFYDKDKFEQKLVKKHNAQPLPENKLYEVLTLFKDSKYFTKFKEFNLLLSKKLLKESVTEDQLIIQAIANIQELDKTINLLTKRLREWYSLYYPELAENMTHHQKFVELVATKSREDLLKEVKLVTMGADLDKVHVTQMKILAENVLELFNLQNKHKEYLKNVMKEYCPNILELAGTTIGAKLLELAKGLRRMALLPASTVQLLGAEKALFRHIKTGSRSPKYGVIFHHPLVQNADRNDRGKAARILADKLVLCARLDFFKGEFKAGEYKNELEDKLK